MPIKRADDPDSLYHSGISGGQLRIADPFERQDDALPVVAATHALSALSPGNVIVAEPGGDILVGTPGDDSFIGTADGRDIVVYISEAGAITMSADGQSASGPSIGHDTYTSIEEIWAGSGNDVLYSPADGGALHGGGGNDTLTAGPGGAILRGEGGDDTLIGGAGIDTADYTNDPAGVVMSADGLSVTGTGSGHDTLSGIEKVVGSSNDDTLQAAAAGMSLNGGSGDDTLIGGPGDDTLDGGISGFDTVDYSAQTAAVRIIDANATGSGIGHDTLANIDKYLMGSGDDVVSVFGSYSMDGGAGTDYASIVLRSTSGAKSFSFTPGGTTTLPDGNVITNVEYLSVRGGQDTTITFRHLLHTPHGIGENFWQAGSGFHAVAILDMSDDTTGIGTVYQDTTLHLEQDFHNLQNEVIWINGVDRYEITTGSGADVLVGRGGNDVVDTGSGNDSLDGGDGNDTLAGGPGDDVLTGGTGTNILDGGTGNDLARYTGAHTDYAIAAGTDAGTFTLDGLPPGVANVHDTVSGVERFQFSDGIFTFDGAAQITSQYVDHGTSATLTEYDTAGQMPWSTVVTQFSLGMSIASKAVTTDAGTRWVNSYDIAAGQPWRWTTDSFDANGHQLTHVQTNDDGTHVLVLYDAADAFAWADATLSFDANWNQTGLSSNADVGGRAATAGEVGVALDTALWFATPYDPDFGGPVRDDVLTGGAGNDVLYGFAGNDTIVGGPGGSKYIVGGTGNDVLTGSPGQDVFAFRIGDGVDTITNFTAGDSARDVLDLHGYGVSSFGELIHLMAQVGPDTVITLDAENRITLSNFVMTHLNDIDFVFS
jgi:Ca2+-binding RTX toxin-like protein